MKIGLSLLVFSLVTGAWPAAALDLGSGTLPIKVSPAEPVEADDSDQITLSGTVGGKEPVIVVLRVDDGRSGDYASRVNLERVLPAGPFEWTTPLKGTRTSGGRILQADDIRRIILFKAKGSGAVRISKFAIEKAPALPGNAIGYSLGKADAPLFAGFTRLTETARELEGGTPVAILRPGVDPMIASGIRGLSRIRLPWYGNKARVSLWTEDVGEWERLPHSLERRIRVNGQTVLQERSSGSDWILERYLRGRDAEAPDDLDPWEAYGKWRGGLVTSVVDVVDGAVVIDLAGDSPAATYLSSVLIEDADNETALEEVQERRASWFRSLWRVETPAEDDPEQDIPVLKVGSAAGMPPLRLALAPGTGGVLRFGLRSNVEKGVSDVSITSSDPHWASTDVYIWAAQERLERVATGGNLLVPAAMYLRTEHSKFPVGPERDRFYAAWIGVSRNQEPGLRKAAINVRFVDQSKMTIPVEIEVLQVALPQPSKPVGFYLDEAPHLTWFRDLAGQHVAQSGCDMGFLARLSITGNAPMLSTPFAERKNSFLSDSLQALQYATDRNWLAYAPAKRLLQKLGVNAAAAAIEEVEKELRLMDLPPPVWSIADEPSNASENPQQLSSWAAALRREAAGVQLAGHLNAPQDFELATLFDVVLVNQGFGLAPDRLSRLREKGVDVWLYNTGKPRFTAGFGLWASPAQRYLQWHARMPTADPFDPTDGREGDVQMFPPMPDTCAEQPDIHQYVLEMAEGLVDQRWLAWLETRPEREAQNLRDTFRSLPLTLSNGWTGLDHREIAELRSQIEQLARDLK